MPPLVETSTPLVPLESPSEASQARKVIVGDPLNMDGSPSELGERARKFGRRLHGRLGLPVTMTDERLSSFEAKQNRREHGHQGDFKKHPVDSYAAELILQTWLASNTAD